MTSWARMQGTWHILALVPADWPGCLRIATACGLRVVVGPGWLARDVADGRMPVGTLCGRCYVPTGALIGGRLDFEVVR